MSIYKKTGTSVLDRHWKLHRKRWSCYLRPDEMKSIVYLHFQVTGFWLLVILVYKMSVQIPRVLKAVPAVDYFVLFWDLSAHVGSDSVM